MKNVSMKTKSICSNMVQKVLHSNVYVMRKGGLKRSNKSWTLCITLYLYVNVSLQVKGEERSGEKNV